MVLFLHVLQVEAVFTGESEITFFCVFLERAL
jgi:hypothetical protein